MESVRVLDSKRVHVGLIFRSRFAGIDSLGIDRRQQEDLVARAQII
jgi:hypothetical protein